MRAGPKRHRVDIKLPSTTQGTRGQRTGDSTTKAERVQCSIQTLAGRELEIARQVVSNATLEVRMRWPGFDVTTKHFLQFGTRTLNIGHVNNVDQLNHELILTCGEAV